MVHVCLAMARTPCGLWASGNSIQGSLSTESSQFHWHWHGKFKVFESLTVACFVIDMTCLSIRAGPPKAKQSKGGEKGLCWCSLQKCNRSMTNHSKSCSLAVSSLHYCYCNNHGFIWHDLQELSWTCEWACHWHVDSACCLQVQHVATVQANLAMTGLNCWFDK